LRLLTYRRSGIPALAVLKEEKVIDVSSLMRCFATSRGLPSQALEQAGDPANFYRLGVAGLRTLSDALEECSLDEHRVDVNLDRDVLEPPVTSPSKIVGIGLNYMDHVKEIGARPPKEPIPFLKAPSSLVGHNDRILLPPDLSKVDYEVELVIVIGRKVKYATKREALESMLGFTIGNDVSARDVQVDRRRPWSWAKSYDTFSPLGPAVVTCDEVDCESPDLEIRLDLNGKTMQRSRTSEMIFKPHELITFVSRIMTLYPGDLIFTGTPSGVGFRRDPPVYLKDGDVLELYIENIGLLRNYVKNARVETQRPS
jgi:2-keto-4-pentenoate hydratase/2-oxohepta-3-ene-1,7-dioic acid hydratase in catechol pathway